MQFDAVIIGAGAAGLFCAAIAGQRGLQVLVIDHSAKVAEKIRISGGGRCNFTNRDLDPAAPHKYFLSENPHFCRSALARFTPQDFMGLLARHGIAFHEKHKGQMFCDRSAADIVDMLLAECDAATNAGGSVTRWQPCAVEKVVEKPARQGETGVVSYGIHSDRGLVTAPALVVATGGLSIPKIGATDFGYRLAQQFGLSMVPPRPALVPLTFPPAGSSTPDAALPFGEMAGLSLPVTIACGEKKHKMEFAEDLLFTHRGLSGPGVLQISSYWTHPGTIGSPLRIDLAPQVDLQQLLLQAKKRSRKRVANELSGLLPARLAEAWVGKAVAQGLPLELAISDAQDKALVALAKQLHLWEITPNGTEGYAKAEVTAGGVSTRELSSQTMESRQPGLYFIGEVVDVTGWLGGYNFQWAWASAHACASALANRSAVKTN
jgi:hypothetical protein